MKTNFTFITLLLILKITNAQYLGPIPPVSTGYGSDGANQVGNINFQNPFFTTENIKIYYPSSITTKVPTLFYSHAYGGNISSSVFQLMQFVAKKGYAIVFVPYQTAGPYSILDRYQNLREGFRKAARDYPSIIDTTKVGFIGHSLGGGASFAIAYKCFTENNWGQNGRFIHSSAPWYCYDITQAELQSFPSNTKLLIEVYDDDPVNDHRMAVDMFTQINIPPSEKDFITVKSDTINNYIYEANHDLPTNSSEFDALDYYAYFRLIDALCDYTFNGSLLGKNVALGNGSATQITMPTGLKNLVQTDFPAAIYSESKYLFPCSAAANPRNAYCGLITRVKDLDYSNNRFKVYPNPSTGIFNLSISTNSENTLIDIYNSYGKKIISLNNALEIDISEFSSGIYLMNLIEDGKNWQVKLIKQ